MTFCFNLKRIPLRHPLLNAYNIYLEWQFFNIKPIIEQIFYAMCNRKKLVNTRTFWFKTSLILRN